MAAALFGYASASAGIMANTAIADTVTQATRVLAQGGAFVADGWAAETRAVPGSLSDDSDDMIDLLDRGLSADQSGDATGAQRLFEEVIAKYEPDALHRYYSMESKLNITAVRSLSHRQPPFQSPNRG